MPVQEEDSDRESLIRSAAFDVASRESSGAYSTQGYLPQLEKEFIGVRLEKPWLSLFIILFIEFLDSVSFTIIIPSLWPYIDSLGGPPEYVGFVIAATSAASFLASPLVGYWIDRRPAKEVLCVALILVIAGNVWYSFATKPIFLLASRAIVGLGRASNVVAKTYLSFASSPSQRTKMMSILNVIQILGFTSGPAFAALLGFLHFETHHVKVNAFTAPGLFTAALAVFNLIALAFLKEVKGRQRRAINAAKKRSTLTWRSLQNKTAVITCIWLGFNLFINFSVFETVGNPITRQNYGWGVQENGIMYAIAAFEAILMMGIIHLSTRKVQDRQLILLSCFGQAVGYGLLIPWNFQHFSSWLPMWRFLLGISIASASYTVGLVIVLSLYSKLIDGGHQGFFMGLFSAATSLARMLGPLSSGIAFQYGGGFLVFISTTSLFVFTLVIAVLLYSLLRPSAADQGWEPAVVKPQYFPQRRSHM